MIRKTLVPLIVPACALPALALNVWPRIENMLASGISSQELGIVLLVSISALGMTAVPFAMQKAPNRGFWWFCLMFGLALGTLNYMMAVGAIGKAHDTGISGTLNRQHTAASLQSRIEGLHRERKNLGDYRPTNSDMLSSADRAVQLAIEARDQECGKVGDFCRARQAQLSTRQEERAQLAASAAITARADNLDRQLAELTSSLEKLGFVPEIADPQAARISRVVGVFVTLGPEAHVRVADYLISFLAIFAEALALGMPRIILTALERPEQAPALPPLQIALRPVAPKKLAYKPSAPVPSPAAMPPANGDLETWITTKLMKSTNRIKQWDLYSEYKRSTGQTAVDLETFHQAVSRYYQIQIENRRPFYLNVALRTSLKLIA